MTPGGRATVQLSVVVFLGLFLLIVYSLVPTNFNTFAARTVHSLSEFTTSTRGSKDNKLRYNIRNQVGLVEGNLPFRIPDSLLTKLGYPLRNFSDDPDDELVFVTAASGRHHRVAMDAVASIHGHFPNKTIYYYDLDGAPSEHVKKIRWLCNVRYRRFNYKLYPSHVRNLHTYAFKPILIHELLHRHRSLFWVDSSIRFKTGDLRAVMNQTRREGRGIMFFDNCGHSNFAATHSGMYRYLPISKEDAAKTKMRGASAIYMQCSKQLYDNVIRWWFLCALVEGCIAPTRALACRIRARDVYGNCHRYDQSAINILLANYFDNDDSAYFSPYMILKNVRGSYRSLPLSVCN